MADDRHDSRRTPPESTPERTRADELRGIALHKSQRRERARRRGTDNIWSWMGMFGLVGWTVAVPTLLGLALGVFLDNRIDSSVSFTITFLVVGVATGAAMAWYWVRRESQGDDGS
jgi:ATP synthase protein I